jgi:hypothetical protein
MAERVRNSEWKQDQLLQNDIKKYVLGNLYDEIRLLEFRHWSWQFWIFGHGFTTETSRFEQ